ncbi:hypothetical protein P8452_34203 [Trifolium repens]|nr:hypothetical protein P8452_34203 [Trifolium repens]
MTIIFGMVPREMLCQLYVIKGTSTFVVAALTYAVFELSGSNNLYPGNLISFTRIAALHSRQVYINTLVSISYLIMKTMYDYYEDKEDINISLRVAQNSKIYYRNWGEF